MADDEAGAAATFESLASSLLAEPDVTLSDRRGFSQGGLMVAGKLFAIRHGAALLLKLPAARVTTLIAAGAGDPFTAGKDRPMREWVLANAGSGDRWPALAREAMAFVRKGKA